MHRPSRKIIDLASLQCRGEARPVFTDKAVIVCTTREVP